MSRAGNNITGGLGGLTKSTELRQRIFFVVFALIVFRLGSFITLPGIDPSVMKFLFEQVCFPPLARPQAPFRQT